MARLEYRLQVVDLDAEENNVIDDIKTDDAQLVIDTVTCREYELCEMLSGCDNGFN